MSTTYRVIVKGIKDGANKDVVISQLAALFKVKLEQVLQMLNTPDFIMKRGVDAATASRYMNALNTRGCVCIVEPETEPPAVANNTTATHTPAAVTHPEQTTVAPKTLKPCKHCNENIPVTAKFCRYCGTNQESVATPTPTMHPCKRCNENIPVTAYFCRHCGTSQTGQTTQPLTLNSDSIQQKGNKTPVLYICVAVIGAALVAGGLIYSNQHTDSPVATESQAEDNAKLLARIEAQNAELDVTSSQKGNTQPTTGNKTLSITDIDYQGDHLKVLSLDGKIVYNKSSLLLGIDNVFHFRDRDVYLISKSEGGNACAGTYVFLTVKSDGSVSYTDDFGSCSTASHVSQNGDGVDITIPDSQGRGDESWTYTNDVLAQTKKVDANLENTAPVLAFQESQPVIVQGEILNGSPVILKLPTLTRLNGDVFCTGYTDQLSINADSIPPSGLGARNYIVTIECPHSGAFISSIKANK